MLRIVGGHYKRTPIVVVDAEGLRPTPDRVRETLFNWIGPRINNAATLDLFAGTGALSFEAASRGAKNLVLVEQARKPAEHIARLIAKLEQVAWPAGETAPRYRLVRQDAQTCIGHLRGEVFDLVLLDPPFDKDWIEAIAAHLPPLMRPGSLLYVEAEKEMTAESLPDRGHWQRLRAARAGQVHYHLFEYAPSP